MQYEVTKAYARHQLGDIVNLTVRQAQFLELGGFLRKLKPVPAKTSSVKSKRKETVREQDNNNAKVSDTD